MKEPLVVAEKQGAVGFIRINRPQALNALSAPLMKALNAAREAFDVDDSVQVIVIAGCERAFAAGADVAEMAAIKNSGEAQALLADHLARWDALARSRKPTIAAVSGFALGGGLELAMACDVIIAAHSAVFGMPEALIGVIPGAGGVRRLTAAVGRALAIDMLLTGRRLNAQEALAAGLVSRVVATDELLPQALMIAGDIAKAPALAVRAIKAASVMASGQSEDALAQERCLFYELFDTADQKEGMRAFLEKRPAKFSSR